MSSLSPPMLDRHSRADSLAILDPFDEKSVQPEVVEQSSYYEDQRAEQTLDGKIDTRWNGGHLSGWDVPNWIVFDFGESVRVTRFGIRLSGDFVHDVKEFDIQTSTSCHGFWKTAASFTCVDSTTSWQEFHLSAIDRFWRIFIKSRYTRYQAYVVGIYFDASTDLGRFTELSNVERAFLQKSNRQYSYPNERVGVIETQNVAELGQLTALTFLEWITNNPDGVIGLPTGKTPEYFIKWLKFYKEKWNEPHVQEELKLYGIPKTDTFPDTSKLRFVQLDEFFPISAKRANSFLTYVKKYYVSTLDLKEENLQLIDFSTIPLFKEHDIDEVFPTGKVDLSLLRRNPQNELEKLQKMALRDTEDYCKDYENRLRQLGGYGFFLGGIGHDGHIAFNFRNCDPHLGTRLVTLNYETSAQSATDFGGIQHTRNKTAMTVGLSSIIYNKKARVIIMASGEKKAKRVREAIMLPKDPLRPSSVLHALPGARFFLTQGSSVHLSDRRTEDVERSCKSCEITENELFKVTCNLALKLNKKVVHLSAEDFLSNPYSRPVYHYWVKQSRALPQLTRKCHEYLVHSLERGISLPAGQRILHTSPHHDDIMLAYHEITPFLFEHNTNFCAYITSGFTSVTDGYVSSLLNRVNLESLDDEKYYLKASIETEMTEILNNFALGYKTGNEIRMNNAETFFALKCVKNVWNLQTIDELKNKIKWLLQEYFPNKNLGSEDSAEVQLLKGSIRETECDRMWAIQSLPAENVLHVRSKFYKGQFFNPMPTIDEDAKPMLELYGKTNPDLISVAFDPEGTGPDTHYKVLQVLAQALRLGKSQKAAVSPKVWGYRNVWHRFHLCDTNIAIPISAKMMHEMHQTFLCSFGSQKKAEFPSPEYDGPFSVLSQRFHVEQLKELHILLGKDYFDSHWNEQIRHADGIILLTEMDVDEFLKHAEDLQNRIELKQL